MRCSRGRGQARDNEPRSEQCRAENKCCLLSPRDPCKERQVLPSPQGVYGSEEQCDQQAYAHECRARSRQ